MASSLKSRLEAQSEFERYECKYVVHPAQIPAIREFLRTFCIPDPNAEGDLPFYTLSTLQLDSAALDLHRAKSREAVNRFKLRIRNYGSGADGPFFPEIKRKIKGVVAKSRLMLPRDCWGPEFLRTPPEDLPCRNRHEALNLAEFQRLARLLDARPVMWIQYDRESYLGRSDRYARVTFDVRLRYARARGWERPAPPWTFRPFDLGPVFDQPFSGVILELKTYRDAPLWMVELTERFNLIRVGFCKYSAAIEQEQRCLGYSETCGSDHILYSVVGI